MLHILTIHLSEAWQPQGHWYASKYALVSLQVADGLKFAFAKIFDLPASILILRSNRSPPASYASAAMVNLPSVSRVETFLSHDIKSALRCPPQAHTHLPWSSPSCSFSRSSVSLHRRALPRPPATGTREHAMRVPLYLLTPPRHLVSQHRAYPSLASTIPVQLCNLPAGTRRCAPCVSFAQ